MQGCIGYCSLGIFVRFKEKIEYIFSEKSSKNLKLKDSKNIFSAPGQK